MGTRRPHRVSLANRDEGVAAPVNRVIGDIIVTVKYPHEAGWISLAPGCGDFATFFPRFVPEASASRARVLSTLPSRAHVLSPALTRKNNHQKIRS